MDKGEILFHIWTTGMVLVLVVFFGYEMLLMAEICLKIAGI